MYSLSKRIGRWLLAINITLGVIAFVLAMTYLSVQVGMLLG